MTVTEVIRIALDPDGDAIIEIKEGEILTKNDIVCLAHELNKLRNLAEAEYKRGYKEGLSEKGHWHKEGSSEMVDISGDVDTVQLERRKTIDILTSIRDTLEAERKYLYSIFIMYRASKGKKAMETLVKEAEMQGVITAINIVKAKYLAVRHLDM